MGDHRLYLSCTGSGEPTVILEPGLGGTSAAWGWIAPTVAAHTRVCVYDRAGRGRSEPSPTPQDGDQIATDLHTLLERAGITGPLVMVGHSLGGLYVLDYAARYPAAGRRDGAAGRHPTHRVHRTTRLPRPSTTC